MTPKEVEKLFEAYVKRIGGVPIRFQDMADANGAKLKTNPSDYVCVYKDGSVYSEVKSFNGDRFPFSNIKTSQRAWAGVIIGLGQPYMFYIYHQPSTTWFLVPAFIILDKLKQGVKSLSLADLAIFKIATGGSYDVCIKGSGFRLHSR